MYLYLDSGTWYSFKNFHHNSIEESNLMHVILCNRWAFSFIFFVLHTKPIIDPYSLNLLPDLWNSWCAIYILYINNMIRRPNINNALNSIKMKYSPGTVLFFLLWIRSHKFFWHLSIEPAYSVYHLTFTAKYKLNLIAIHDIKAIPWANHVLYPNILTEWRSSRCLNLISTREEMIFCGKIF